MNVVYLCSGLRFGGILMMIIGGGLVCVLWCAWMSIVCWWRCWNDDEDVSLFWLLLFVVGGVLFVYVVFVMVFVVVGCW